jgi:hypothetical protein
VFGKRGHEAIDGHQLGELAGALREAGLGQHVIKAEPAPHLVRDMDGAGLARVLYGNAVGMHGDEVGGGRLTVNGRRRFCRVSFGFLDFSDDDIDGGLGLDGLLARKGGFNSVGEGKPIVLRGGSEGAKRTEDPMAWAIGRGDRLDQEVVDVGFAARVFGCLLDEQACL